MGRRSQFTGRASRANSILIFRFLPAEYCFLSAFVVLVDRWETPFILIPELGFDSLGYYYQTAEHHKDSQVQTPLHFGHQYQSQI